MKPLRKVLLVLVAATAFSLGQPVEANQHVDAGPTVVESVPDSGSTISLLGFALLGMAALRRRLGVPLAVQKRFTLSADQTSDS